MENGQKITNLKLNYKRTTLIGFAFFGILLLWQVYDSWCSTMLTDIISKRMSAEELEIQWIVGIIMACDNLAALILLPIFGSLSDKTKSPIGKRMPYILIGTFVSAIAFPFIPFFFHYNNILGMTSMMIIVLIFMMIYRNPAVALMPDITPKPLRSKANGIINIIGYIGGAFATVLGIFLKLSDYILADASSKNIWIIELPFLIASVLMVITALVLYFTINENKILEEMKDELELGEKMAAVETPICDDKPMSKANKMMLIAILAAEFLWFMADNALLTYLSNFVIYFLGAKSSFTAIMVIVGGVGSVIGFSFAGKIAEKIGGKFTITLGLGISVISLIIMCFIRKSLVSSIDPNTGIEYFDFPLMLFVVWFIKGFGMSLVYNCSFPMVVEFCSSKQIGKYTGYYYASSMLAQTITPVLLGLIFFKTLAWNALPIYSTILLLASFLVVLFFVKNIKVKEIIPNE